MPIKTISAAAKLSSVLTAAALTATLALTACSPPATPARASAAKPPVTLTDCNGLHHSRPGIVNVTCETDAITARSLTWSSWGTPISTAIGTAVVDPCAYEDCHTATYNAYPIVVIASKIVKCATGGQEYSRLQYTFVGPDPFAGLPTKGLGIRRSMFGSHRPGPIHNNTETLPC
jgi:hypothetical protein